MEIRGVVNMSLNGFAVRQNKIRVYLVTSLWTGTWIRIRRGYPGTNWRTFPTRRSSKYAPAVGGRRKPGLEGLSGFSYARREIWRCFFVSRRQCLRRPMSTASNVYGVQCLRRPMSTASNVYGVQCLRRRANRCCLQDTHAAVPHQGFSAQHQAAPPVSEAAELRVRTDRC